MREINLLEMGDECMFYYGEVRTTLATESAEA